MNVEDDRSDMGHKFFLRPKGNEYYYIKFIFCEFLCVGHFNLKIDKNARSKLIMTITIC